MLFYWICCIIPCPFVLHGNNEIASLCKALYLEHQQAAKVLLTIPINDTNRFDVSSKGPSSGIRINPRYLHWPRIEVYLERLILFLGHSFMHTCAFN